jgi:hypothetical protein
MRDGSQNEQEVERAFALLLSEAIPSLALFLETNFSNIPLDKIQLSAIVHNFGLWNCCFFKSTTGVNIRHIGRLRQHLCLPHLRQFLLIEMLARLLKGFTQQNLKIIVAAEMRAQFRALGTSNTEIHKETALEYLNLVFAPSTNSTQCWESVIKPSLVSKFSLALTQREMEESYALDTRVSLLAVLKRFQEFQEVYIDSAVLKHVFLQVARDVQD